jgi:hypothetical protein
MGLEPATRSRTDRRVHEFGAPSYPLGPNPPLFVPLWQRPPDAAERSGTRDSNP